MITATYIWLDNLLYVEELAKPAANPATPSSTTTCSREKLGPLMKGRLEEATTDAGSYWYTAWTAAGPAWNSGRFARRSSSAYDPLRTGLALRYFCR